MKKVILIFLAGLLLGSGVTFAVIKIVGKGKNTRHYSYLPPELNVPSRGTIGNVAAHELSLRDWPQVGATYIHRWSPNDSSLLVPSSVKVSLMQDCPFVSLAIDIEPFVPSRKNSEYVQHLQKWKKAPEKIKIQAYHKMCSVIVAHVASTLKTPKEKITVVWSVISSEERGLFKDNQVSFYKPGTLTTTQSLAKDE